MNSQLKYIYSLLILMLWLLISPIGFLQAAENDKGVSSNYVAHQILVRFTAETPEGRKNEIRQAVNAELIKIVKSIRVELWQLPDDLTTDETMDYLHSLPEVEYVEPNFLYKQQALPNDPLFGKLWFLHNTGQLVNGLVGAAGADISAPAAWQIETGNRNMVIAVIDSGVAFDHPDLINNIWINTGEIPGNQFDDDDNGYVDDIHGWDFVNNDNNPSDYSTDLYGNGHGTHVAGIIAAEGNNNLGICGVMWHAQIMPLQIFDIYQKNSFYDNLIKLSNILDAIEYAVDNGARIINCSFGSHSYSQFQYDIIAYAHQHGVLVVCAAGNDGTDTDVNFHYPSCYNLPNIISVAATDETDNLASYSNFGIESVDIAAPGGSGIRGNIYSTVPPERITLFYDDLESISYDKWLTSGLYENWSVGYNSYWGSYLQDSSGNYHENENSTVWTRNPIDAANCRGLFFEYEINYELETGYDFLNTEISLDGTSYFPIKEYTGFSNGWLTQMFWCNETDLGLFYLRFHLKTDYLYNYDGAMIDSVKVTAIPWVFTGNEYDFKSGTSMAAPVVSGIAGLVWSLNPSLTHLEVKSCLMDSVDQVDSLAGLIKTGGRVNAVSALGAVSGGLECSGPLVKVNNQNYYLLQNAYDNLADGDTMKVVASIFAESLVFDREVAAVVSGGYNCDFSGRTGMKSVLDGSLMVKKGVVEIDGLLIK